MTMHDYNRYLRGVISQIMEEGLDDELLHMLCVELRFASVNSVNHKGSPMYVKRGEKKYMMLFLSFDDMMNHFPDWSHSHFSFDWFLEYLNCPVYFCIDEKSNAISPCGDFELPDGILFRMGEDEFILEGELLDRLKEYFEIDLYTVAEMRDIFDNLDNSLLDEMLGRWPQDWDEIITEIGKSTMLFMIDVSERSDYEEIDMIFDFLRFDTFGFNREISLSTTRNDPESQYAVIINFKKAVDHVLKFGLAGLAIRTPAGEAFMSRNLLIEKYELIEKYCDDEKLKKSHEFIFKL
jgi:hypothetical protein